MTLFLRLKLYQLYLKIAAYLLPACACALGLLVWKVCWVMLGQPRHFSMQGHLNSLALSTFVWVFMAEHYKVTSVDELFRERTGARAAWSACTTTSLTLLAVLYFSRNDSFPRGLLIASVLALLSLTVLLRALFRALCRKRLAMVKPTRLLVIGADEFAREAASRLRRLSFAPCEVVAYVRLPGQDIAVHDHHIYEFEQLGALNASHAIDEAVIAIVPGQFSQLPKIIQALTPLCFPSRAVVDFGEGIVVRDKLFQLGNMQVLDLTKTPAENLDYAVLKRVLDICFSILLLILLSPLLALIALVLRVASTEPVFFAQERVGLNGRTFRMYKFRTMRGCSNKESDTQWTTVADPRRTLVGAFLRKTSLDELPQFLNVLKGDMSVVGPRPERPHFVHKFLQEITQYNYRHSLKVGITGWAQVNGWRGDTSIEKRIEHDLYYLQNWSLSLDLRIIVMTVFSALIGKHAY